MASIGRICKSNFQSSFFSSCLSTMNVDEAVPLSTSDSDPGTSFESAGYARSGSCVFSIVVSAIGIPYRFDSSQINVKPNLEN